MSRLLAPARYEQIKCIAADFIEDYALAYPLRPLEIADQLGVHVSIHAGELPSTGRFCPTTDGFTEPFTSRHGTKFTIHATGAVSERRQRFTLMHELAHIWLDHPRADSSLTDDRAEGEANFLAGYLLAPDVLVVEWVPDLSVNRISDTFDVSDDAAQQIFDRVFRARNLGVIGKSHDHRILDAATRHILTDEDVVGCFLGLA